MHASVVAFVVLLSCSFAAAAATERPVNALAKSCRFTLGNQRFDLCPVFESKSGGWSTSAELQTPPTITKTEYKISLQEPLKRSKKVPGHEQCPDGTWICLIVSNTRPKHEDEEPRVLRVVPVAGELDLPTDGDDFARDQYVPGLNITTKLVPANKQTKHDILHMHLHGGYYVYKQQKADFQFVCDHKAEEPTTPTALWNWNGTHTFEWRTKHACGTAISRKPPTPPPTTDEPEEDEDPDAPPKDAEDDKTRGDKKLVDPDFFGGRSRRSMMTLFASTASVIFVLAYLVYFPPQRLRQIITTYAKTHPWLLRSRVGERVLVRWASEDFGIGPGEEDTMVNNNGEFEGIAMDEQIPLKPSPRRPIPVNYGSAQ